MGGDGGSIPQREDLIRSKKKAQTFERSVTNILRWRLCALTQQPLKQPIVVCGLGRLYVKEALIEALLSRGKGKPPEDDPLAPIAHIRSMKEVCVANLTLNPAYDASVSDHFADTNMSPFICPVVGLELNGVHRFILTWSCGHVLSEKALRTVDGDHTCLVCGELYIDDDLIYINPTEEEALVYAERCVARRQLRRAVKKAVKDEPFDEDDPAAVRPPVGHLARKAPTVAKTDVKDEKLSGDRKRAAPPSSSAIAKAQCIAKGAKATDIQLDPTKSNTFKSLFTTSEGGQKQPRAHWVTHNPQYY